MDESTETTDGRCNCPPDARCSACGPRKAEAEQRMSASQARLDLPILRFFEYEHLPERLQLVSRDFAYLAYRVAELPRGPETSTALRKLLEAKDAAVRAAL